MRRLFLLLILSIFPLALGAETTMTYQGQLQDESGPYSGNVDLSFELHDAESGGTQVGPTLEHENVATEDGLFQVELDFGDQPYETGLFLEVRVNGEPLDPRQPINAAPLAVRSLSGNNGESVWSVAGDDIHYTSGDVGIGTDSPGTALQVKGSGQFGSDENSALGESSFVTGGFAIEDLSLANSAEGDFSAIVGGADSSIEGDESAILGGFNNTAKGSRSAIAGGHLNTAEGGRSAIAGGRSNNVGADDSAIAGGRINSTVGDESAIAGGNLNTAEGDRSAIAGGRSNSTGGINSAIAGGEDNTTSDSVAFIGGGHDNTAEGWRSAIAGGRDNTASGSNAFIGGGSNNTAGADNTFAVGSGAQALHANSFVWSGGGGSERGEMAGAQSTAENQFVVAASGSVRFLSDETRSMGVELAPGGSGWSVVSDREAKTAIEKADQRQVLEKVMALPISEYSYKSQDESIRHMGPMAQDFYPLFGLGEDELRVSAINLAGIALAAIQGLNKELAKADERNDKLAESVMDMENENAELRDQVAELREQVAANSKLAERNAELEDRLAALEALLFEDRKVAKAKQ